MIDEDGSTIAPAASTPCRRTLRPTGSASNHAEATKVARRRTEQLREQKPPGLVTPSIVRRVTCLRLTGEPAIQALVAGSSEAGPESDGFSFDVAGARPRVEPLGARRPSGRTDD